MCTSSRQRASGAAATRAYGGMMLPHEPMEALNNNNNSNKSKKYTLTYLGLLLLLLLLLLQSVSHTLKAVA